MTLSDTAPEDVPARPRRGRPRQGDIRARVIETAVDLFAAQGYDATSVQQIVTAAGTTKGGFYHHFAAKEELLYAMYHESIAGQLADLQRILALGQDPERTLRAVIESIVCETAATMKANSVFAQEIARMDPERYQQLQVDWRQYQDSVRELIRSAQESGRFALTASPQVVSWAIFGVTNSLHTWFRPDGPMTAQQIAGELADLMMAGLTPKESP
ncbi:TetR/AcrR family transcriptional regulator [Streptacidiphilus cavernicola]|uniref:TetR/AcrR family transcriptional regulator n=1 Tax=Streptacidiphilus cavernicola TaxID=3342716 RepID=A0ABV6VMZ7_9ACTN